MTPSSCSNDALACSQAIVGNSPPSLVAGLDECLLSKMPVGEKRRVVIPPKLAGQGNVLGAMQVPAGETLYVEVRLRSISLNTPGLSTIGLNIIFGIIVLDLLVIDRSIPFSILCD